MLKENSFIIKTSLGAFRADLSDNLKKLKQLNLIKKYASSSNNKIPLVSHIETQLNQYLLGRLTSFDIPITYSGTPFQQRVWDALLRIPYGKTVSYQYIAKKINSPHAVRAVGTAISRNPIMLIVPCHRVIKSSGAIGEFAYGSKLKEKLLKIEKNI